MVQNYAKIIKLLLILPCNLISIAFNDTHTYNTGPRQQVYGGLRNKTRYQLVVSHGLLVKAK